MSECIEVGLDPCSAEGGCPLRQECKVQAIDCYSFRCYVADWPKIGVDHERLKKDKGYHFYGDRGFKRKRMKEYLGLLGPWKEHIKDFPWAAANITDDDEPGDDDD
jgi:hypothetical protein